MSRARAGTGLTFIPGAPREPALQGMGGPERAELSWAQRSPESCFGSILVDRAESTVTIDSARGFFPHRHGLRAGPEYALPPGAPSLHTRAHPASARRRFPRRNFDVVPCIRLSMTEPGNASGRAQVVVRAGARPAQAFAIEPVARAQYDGSLAEMSREQDSPERLSSMRFTQRAAVPVMADERAGAQAGKART
jgi:hypothetical protein